jgi:uncharacterized protein YbjT (DUF2867 family)
MSVVINTPNGNIGRTLANVLLDAGQAVTLISRDLGKVEGLISRGAKAVPGSMDDHQVLRTALEGASALFWVTPPPARPDHHEWAVGTAVTAAELARRAGVKHVVILSSVGAHHGPGSGPVGALLDIELAFQRRIPNVVALRAGFFMENVLRDMAGILSGTVYSAIPAGKPFPMVASRDIAHKAAAFLLSRNWQGHRAVGVHGPRDLSHAEVFAELSQLLGREIKYVEVPLQTVSSAMAGFGMPDFLVNTFTQMYGAVLDGRLDSAEPRTPETTTHTSFRVFARKVLLPAIAAAGGAPGAKQQSQA